MIQKCVFHPKLLQGQHSHCPLVRESPAVRILHQTIVKHQIMARKGAQRSECTIRTKCWDCVDPTP